MKIDHIGIAVKDIEHAIKYWNDVFGYKQATEVVLNTRQKVFNVFIQTITVIFLRFSFKEGSF